MNFIKRAIIRKNLFECNLKLMALMSNLSRIKKQIDALEVNVKENKISYEEARDMVYDIKSQLEDEDA